MPRRKLQLSNKSHISVLSGDGHRVTAVDELRDRFAVDALIRLHITEFQEFLTLRDFYTHFNLERTLNSVGKRYAILPIVRPGYRNSEGQEVLPVVDAEQFRTALCVEVAQAVPIASVDRKYFSFSIPSVRNGVQLGKTLLRRYARLFPGSNKEELLSRGCAISLLRLE